MARPLPELVLFLDECLGSKDVPDALRGAGLHVELLHQHFPAGTSDASWLAEVGRRGWVVLTKDQRIRFRKSEIDTLLASGVAAFVLSSGGLSGPDMGVAFVKAYPRMQKFLRDHAPPFVVKVDRRGKLQAFTAAQRRAAQKKDP